jgi:hypothetical protein
MKKNHRKTLLTAAGAALLCAATWQIAPSETIAYMRVKGQDMAGKKCERVEQSGSVFGKCERVCKDLDVIRDPRRNNRLVCTNRVVRIPR